MLDSLVLSHIIILCTSCMGTIIMCTTVILQLSKEDAKQGGLSCISLKKFDYSCYIPYSRKVGEFGESSAIYQTKITQISSYN